MKILVTGGSGFIGSTLVRQLLHGTDYVICNVDKVTYAGAASVVVTDQIAARYMNVQIDIRNKDALSNIFQHFRPDVVFHLAGETHVDRSIDDGSLFIETNVVGTYTLLEVVRYYLDCLDIGRRKEFRFIHISTDEVYGDIPPGAPGATEDSKLCPSSPYSASKAASDSLVQAWGRTYEIPFIITRSSNNYGPFQFPEKLIPRAICSAMLGKNIPIYGDGLQTRDWLFVGDYAALLADVCTEGEVGAIYNVSGNNEMENGAVVVKICSILSRVLSEDLTDVVEFHELIEHVEDRPGHDRRYSIDSSKVEQELNWRQRNSFQKGLEETIRWYVDNEVWWRPLFDGYQ